MPKTEVHEFIAREIEALTLIDTHEHVMDERFRHDQPIDLFYLFSHYASSDLVSSGLSEQALHELRDPARPLDARWEQFAPFWGHCRTTGYGRAILLAVQDLFDIQDINQDTYTGLSQKLQDSQQMGWYQHVLKDRANIQMSIVDPLSFIDPTLPEDMDRNFFAPVFRMDDFITGCSRVDLRSLASRTNTAIHCLDDLLNALDVEFARALKSGVVALKVGLAYERSLHFEKTAKADAERIFNRLDQFFVPLAAESQQPPVSWNEAKPLQDYLMHQVIRRAIEHKLPIQIHTGLQEGTGNYLPNANPMHLVNLFIEYPEAKFVLFHAGYPYQGEMVVLGKNFANVYLDLCWVHIISPWVARQILHEWIETVPANKIFAFGGDYLFVEGVYAHSRMARANVAEVLSQKVERGYLSEDEALNLGRKFLRENALQFYKLDD